MVEYCNGLLWRCRLGGGKGIRPVKTELWGRSLVASLSVWSEVQMICIWSSWCHCHPVVSCSSKIHNGLPFWCRPAQVVLEKRTLNGCSSSSRSSSSSISSSNSSIFTTADQEQVQNVSIHMVKSRYDLYVVGQHGVLCMWSKEVKINRVISVKLN